MGAFWTTDTQEQREAVLTEGEEVWSRNQIIYLGCTINFEFGSRVPHNMSQIRRDTQQQLEHVRLAPAAAMMMIDSKVPSKWYTVANVYKPNLGHHGKNDGLLMRTFKQTTGLSRYAKTQAIWAPQKDSGIGLAKAVAHHAVAVQREWIRHYASCKQYFREGLRDYLKEIHTHLGGCPAVLLPRLWEFRIGPHIWACLQHVITQVELPMWLPGECSGISHILMNHRVKAGPMASPEELV